jgi:FkbM family methyltransferase
MLFLGNRDVSYRVGEIPLVLPAEHRLPEYQEAFDLYDRKIGLVAQAVYSVFPDSVGVDVGANVGDSAAAIRERSDMPLICIEGDEAYYRYLTGNAPAIGGLTCVHSLVGSETGTVSGHLHRHDGTGEFVRGEGVVEARSLPDILRESGIDFSRVSLVKTDTDGFDFAILLGSESLIAEAKPCLFFEYVIDDAESAESSIALIDSLESKGYQFVVFDNFGNTMRTVMTGAHGAFLELNAYIVSGMRHGGGIPYVDVFACSNPKVLEAVAALESLAAFGTII